MVFIMTDFKTPQENFWSGDFGLEYSKRVSDDRQVLSNIDMFSKIFKCTGKINSAVELGCNIGLNLRALNQINPEINLTGYEINEYAVNIVNSLNIAKIEHDTILSPIKNEDKYDLSFTKVVLIHINPDELESVYENLYNLSNKYILVVEYYNPSPVTVSYRGNEDRLFKRDFAGEMIDKYNLRLLDYGFIYHRDNHFPLDDMTWFLMEK
jgi:pseudaminic acid biosynthesis-associated methylase